MGKHDAAERAHQIAGGENAKRLDQHQPVRHVCRKEQLADDGGEEDENDEIVEFQGAPRAARPSVLKSCEVRRRGAVLLVMVGDMFLKTAGRKSPPPAGEQHYPQCGIRPRISRLSCVMRTISTGLRCGSATELRRTADILPDQSRTTRRSPAMKRSVTCSPGSGSLTSGALNMSNET